MQSMQWSPFISEFKAPWVMYRDGEPLAGLQRIFELGAEEKLAEVIIPVEFMSNNNRRVRQMREGKILH